MKIRKITSHVTKQQNGKPSRFDFSGDLTSLYGTESALHQHKFWYDKCCTTYFDSTRQQILSTSLCKSIIYAKILRSNPTSPGHFCQLLVDCFIDAYTLRLDHLVDRKAVNDHLIISEIPTAKEIFGLTQNFSKTKMTIISIYDELINITYSKMGKESLQFQHQLYYGNSILLV